MQKSKKLNTKASFSFSLTPSGIGAICLTFIVLPLGFFRGELFALLAGTAFIGYGILSFIFSLINVFLWKKLSVCLSEMPSGKFKISISKKSQFLKLFGSFSKITYYLSYNARTEQGNPTNKWHYFTSPLLTKNIENELPREHVLSPTKTRGERARGERAMGVHTMGEHARGFYVPQNSEIHIIDPAEFFIFHIIQSKQFFPEPLVVFPEPEEPYSSDFLSARASPQKGKSTFNRSEDLYENRNYIPGDDPRKINWKIYSHTGVLALREGELLPPPNTEYTLRFNTEKNVLFPQFQEALFDTLVNRAATIAVDLAKKQIPISTDLTSPFCSFLSNSFTEENEILTALSFPQLELSLKNPHQHTYSQSQIQSPPTAMLLYFTLPGEIPTKLLNLFKKDQVNICVGPFPYAEHPNKLINERYKTEVENTILRLQKEGYYVSKI